MLPKSNLISKIAIATLCISLVVSYRASLKLRPARFSDHYPRLVVHLLREPDEEYLMDVLIKDESFIINEKSTQIADNSNLSARLLSLMLNYHEDGWRATAGDGVSALQPISPGGPMRWPKGYRFTGTANAELFWLTEDELKLIIINNDGEIAVSKTIMQYLVNDIILLSYPSMSVYNIVPLYIICQLLLLFLIALVLEIILLKAMNLQLLSNLKCLIKNNFTCACIIIGYLSLAIYSGPFGIAYYYNLLGYLFVGLHKLKKYRSGFIAPQRKNSPLFTLFSMILCFPYVLIVINIFHCFSW